MKFDEELLKNLALPKGTSKETTGAALPAQALRVDKRRLIEWWSFIKSLSYVELGKIKQAKKCKIFPILRTKRKPFSTILRSLNVIMQNTLTKDKITVRKIFL